MLGWLMCVVLPHARLEGGRASCDDRPETMNNTFFPTAPSAECQPACAACCRAAAYASLDQGMDLDALEDAARTVSSRRKDDLVRKREEAEEAAEEEAAQHKVGRWHCCICAVFMLASE